MAFDGLKHKSAKHSRKFDIHGSYDKKADAKTKEKEVHGFIIERWVRGKKHYIVLTSK